MLNKSSAQRKRLQPTVKMFPSGGATTMIFIVDGAEAVKTFVIRSTIHVSTRTTERESPIDKGKMRSRKRQNKL